jgi:hypothetical protein
VQFRRHAELQRFQAEADNHAAVDSIDPTRRGGAHLSWEDMPYSLHHADWLLAGLYGEFWLERIYATNIDRSLDYVRRRLYDGAVAGPQPRFAVPDAGTRDASGKSAKAVKTASRTSRCSRGRATIALHPGAGKRPSSIRYLELVATVASVRGRRSGAPAYLKRAGDPLALSARDLLGCLDARVLEGRLHASSKIAVLVDVIRGSEACQRWYAHGASTGAAIQSTLIEKELLVSGRKAFYDTADADRLHTSIRAHFRCPAGGLSTGNGGRAVHRITGEYQVARFPVGRTRIDPANEPGNLGWRFNSTPCAGQFL